ncbi:hypothetical protein GCM10011571_24360 [Marinithermofilum abyssi]|jgi:uncharacterized membrane protein|uniref:Uncharacterized protein n=1 Tax=Marinithermofilum abyssi TaxID=1571185 RepID=A0A8J2Y9F4_9BACL|nr:hypothetical protein [Marinithermofilum abyssi]GGE21387.1 hypothetical protein GCM10011571_24360 [Marinithermofilum abyssi]
MSCKLKEALDDLWGGIIRNFEFDLYKSTIKMDIVTIEKAIKNEYLLLFKNVTALYFSNPLLKNALKIKNVIDDEKEEEGFYLELTSISFENNELEMNLKVDNNWFRQYKSQLNFVIEVGDSALLIEADQIVINGHVF